MQQARDLLALARAYAGIIALLGGLAALAGVAWSELSLQEPYKAVATTLFSALASTAFVSLVADVYLRARFASAFASMVGMRDDLRRSGLVRFGIVTELPWVWALEDAKELEIVLVEPYAWMEPRWQQLEAAAAARRLAIRIYLAKAGTPACAALSERLGRSMEESAALAERLLINKWTAARRSKRVKIASTITLYRLDHAPAYTVVRSHRVDNSMRGVMTVGGSVFNAETEHPLMVALSDEGDAEDTVTKWMERQFERIQLDTNIIWAGAGVESLEEIEVPPAPAEPVTAQPSAPPSSTDAGPAPAEPVTDQPSAPPSSTDAAGAGTKEDGE